MVPDQGPVGHWRDIASDKTRGYGLQNYGWVGDLLPKEQYTEHLSGRTMKSESERGKSLVQSLVPVRMSKYSTRIGCLPYM